MKQLTEQEKTDWAADLAALTDNDWNIRYEQIKKYESFKEPSGEGGIHDICALVQAEAAQRPRGI